VRPCVLHPRLKNINHLADVDSLLAASFWVIKCTFCKLCNFIAVALGRSFMLLPFSANSMRGKRSLSRATHKEKD
jgi:hypothetical protein